MAKVEKTGKRGGRTPGTPNKSTQEVRDRLKALDCDPIEGMAFIAAESRREGENHDLQLAGQMYKELAQYVAPKRKAIEVSGALTVDDMSSLTDAQLQAIINGDG